MNKKISKQLNLIEDGLNVYEKTDEFRSKIVLIKKEVSEKYSSRISEENNFFMKILLKIQMKIDIRKRIQEVSSHRNLHISN